MKSRIVALLLLVVLVTGTCPVQVKADDAAFRDALKGFVGVRNLSVTDESVYKWSTVISYLKADGLNDYAIAAFMGCWLYEAGNALYAVEGHGGKVTKEGVKYTDFVAGGVYAYATDCYPPYSASASKNSSTGVVEHKGSGGNGLGGVAQWTWGREENLTAFCGSGVDDGCKLPAGCGFVTVSHNEFREQIPRWEGTATWNGSKYVCNVTSVHWVYKTHKIPDLPGQMVFVLHELKHIPYYKNGCYDKLKTVTNTTEATKPVFQFFEGGGSDWSGSSFTNRANAAAKALPAIQAFTGVTGSAPVGTNPATGQQTNAWGSQESFQSAGAALVDMGMWGTAELTSYCKLTETNLEETLLKVADISNLKQEDLEGLINWQRNHQMEEQEHGYIAVLRWMVVLVGILMILWAVFVYLAFWFDHINSFIYLDALHIVTFGQLHICAPGDKPTFKVSEKVKTKTVNHQQIIGICLTALFFGSLLVSGVFYTIVSRFVNLIVNFLR